MLQIGPYSLASRVVLAPMAGVTDAPFRQLCRDFGAGLAVSEMVTSDSRLWHTRKSQLRLRHGDEAAPRAVQIAGSDPQLMAEAAALNVERGAEIIDINMGCPARKVCRKAAGSALLQDEPLVAKILDSVVKAVSVPVTLKIRTGAAPEQRNGTTIAKIAEQAGIAALAVHGRTRACKFEGAAEYDTIAAIKAAIAIPVIANGDIDTPQKARKVLEYCGADAVMIGRAAQGQPWIFRDINHYLSHGELPAPLDDAAICRVLLQHVQALHRFYGEFMGVKVARKHVGWYLKANRPDEGFRAHFNRLQCAEQQLRAVRSLFSHPYTHSTIDPAAALQGVSGQVQEEVFAA